MRLYLPYQMPTDRLSPVRPRPTISTGLLNPMMHDNDFLQSSVSELDGDHSISGSGMVWARISSCWPV